MKRFFQSQFDFLKSAARGGAPGTNPAGMAQAHWENAADAVWDAGLGPAIRIAGRTAAIGGIIGLGLWANNNLGNDNAGSAAAGTLIGGVIGGALGNIAGHIAGKGIADSKFSGALKWGARYGGGALGVIAGASLGGVGAGLAASVGAGPAVGIIAGAVGASLIGQHFGISPLTGTKAAIRAIGGGQGLMGAAINLAKTGVYASYAGARGLEFGARTLLTGGVRGVQGPLDAWFPFFRNTPTAIAGSTHTVGGVAGQIDELQRDRLLARGVSAAKAEEAAFVKAGTRVIDPRKFAPNPRIVRRMVGMGALFAVGSAFKEAMSPMVAPPTAFFDGRNMRHVNDLGTGGGYGMGVLGRNSSLNMNHQDAARVIAAAF